MDNAKRLILRRQKDWGGESKVLVKRMKPPKQAGMMATRTIKKGETIAYYPIVLIADPGSKTKDPLRNYFIEVRYKGKQNKLVGKPDLAAVAKKPTRGIPYTGLWSNEPYPTQQMTHQVKTRNFGRCLVVATAKMTHMQTGPLRSTLHRSPLFST